MYACMHALCIQSRISEVLGVPRSDGDACYSRPGVLMLMVGDRFRVSGLGFIGNGSGF